VPPGPTLIFLDGMSYSGSWSPTNPVGGPWTVSADSGGTAGGTGTGVELSAPGGARELVTAGQSLSDLDMTVNANSAAQSGPVDGVEVFWHVSGADTFTEFTIGSAGWQVVSSDHGTLSTLASGSDSVAPGDTPTIRIVSSSGVTGVNLNTNPIALVADGSSGDVGIAASNGSDTTFLAVALST
jgi:hypothetical protein